MNQLDKLALIDRVINAVIATQIKTMAEQLRAAQAQTNQLQNQYGKGRRS